MRNMYQTIAEFVPDKLFAGNELPVITQGVELDSGQGVLSRGTILTQNANGLYKMLSSVDEIPIGVLTDTIDTDEQTIATIYASGIFNQDALILGADLSIDNFKLEMRKLNLYTRKVQEN